MCLESLTLAPCCHARAQEAQDFVLTFRKRHDDNASLDRSDGDESIFFLRVLLVVNLQVIDTASEEFAGFLQG